ncbi:Pantoate kinase [Methanonatronarchaeum thermophilum]|uniref:Pantoate kinase n=1 Tax=Methanonatronarchaeum thermophilum TaxID=1927129 RepID=A0A1Y3GBP7_9EURY|nr:pantoate kinase [Methanonatronarchaeum thermophilum]OUJ18848.1 Pantoate kinase [Methanonatronarchaeum thermophilum]
MYCSVWIPGHISGFFEVCIDDCIDRSGSTGVGINLDKGLVVEVDVSRSSETTVDCDGAGRLAILKLLSEVDEEYDVNVCYEYELPVGMGFGMSGAEALGGVLAVSKAIGYPKTVNQLARIAHEAEVELMSGLGDVGAQLYRGVTVNTKPGAPGKNEVDSILVSRDRKVHLLTLDKIETCSVLSDEKLVEKINRSGNDKISRFLEKPTLDNMVKLSREFTNEIEIAPEETMEILNDLDTYGVNASMAMIGQTIFSIESPDILSRFGEVITTGIADRGPIIIELKK